MYFLPVEFEQWLRAARFPAGLLPWMPFTSRAFGPPRRHADLIHYFAHHPGILTEVYPAMPAIRTAPIALNEINSAYFRDVRTMLPSASVFSLPRARLLGSAGWIVGENDTLLTDASFWREPDFPQPFSTHYILGRKRAWPLRRIPGRTLSLASDFAIGGFGHFLHDSLVRLHLVEKAGHRLGDFDWLYLPRIDTPTTRRLVATLGLPADRILQHDPQHDFETEELVATTYPGTPGNLPPYTPKFLRERFASDAKPAHRKIFLSRKGYRRDLANRDEIERLLLARGFEICLPTEVDVINLCAEAAFVVSPEGANLMNTLFSPPGARVLLLLPQSGNTLPYAFTLAAAAGHKLFAQSCPLLDATPGHEGTSPIHADPKIFTAGLDQMLAAS
jgi:capsular polysaccharide biosynthesis protein